MLNYNDLNEDILDDNEKIINNIVNFSDFVDSSNDASYLDSYDDIDDIDDIDEDSLFDQIAYDGYDFIDEEKSNPVVTWIYDKYMSFINWINNIWTKIICFIYDYPDGVYEPLFTDKEKQKLLKNKKVLYKMEHYDNWFLSDYIGSIFLTIFGVLGLLAIYICIKPENSVVLWCIHEFFR